MILKSDDTDLRHVIGWADHLHQSHVWDLYQSLCWISWAASPEYKQKYIIQIMYFWYKAILSSDVIALYSGLWISWFYLAISCHTLSISKHFGI